MVQVVILAPSGVKQTQPYEPGSTGRPPMRKLLLATAAGALIAGTAGAQEEVNVGIILGFTGPLESITPGMAASAELAFKEASDSGLLPGGMTLNTVRGDSTC